MFEEMIVKVCGLREEDNIRAVEALGADWLGFIFYSQSPRDVGGIPGYLPKKSKRVGVFVNELMENVLSKAMVFELDIIQLHGEETPLFCEELTKTGFEVMKSFKIGKEFPVDEVKQYEGVCRYFLFDTLAEEVGGSGKKFDWRLIQHYTGKTPFLLSGGIGPNDVRAVLDFEHPQYYGIDINSLFEIDYGFKDIAKVKDFVEKIRKQ